MGANQIEISISIVLTPISGDLSSDNLCKQFGPRLGLTFGQPDLERNCLTLGNPEGIF